MSSAVLSDALRMVSATFDMGFFRDDEDVDLKTLMDALAKIEVSSTEDFRMTFVVDDVVDKGVMDQFTVGDLGRFRSVLETLAEELIPEGGPVLAPPVEPVRKKPRLSHNVGGRLVFKPVEEYLSTPSASNQGGVKGRLELSLAARKHRETAVKSMAKMQEKLAVGAQEDKSGHLGGSTSLHQRDEGLRVRAVELGYAVLQELGSASPRFQEIFPEGALTRDPGLREAFDDMIIHGVDPKVVISQVAEVWRFLHWLSALGLSIGDISELRVAGFIKNAAGRGKSVPGRVRNSLIWLQHVTGIEIGADKVEIQKMVKTAVGPGSRASDPEGAVMIPVEVVKRLEEGVFRARTGLLKIFCGLGCLLTFGVKRWSDAQHVAEMTIAGDALVVKSWKSKKKKRAILWGALRSGFCGTDWVTPFMRSLKEYGFPGEDYLITAPRTDLMGFTKTPARWGDAERGIHAALIEVGVDVDEAISYSLHSFRHLLVTAARQLGMPEPSIDVMAGWASKSASGMASVYDSVPVSAEFVHKKAVHDNIRRGWTLVPVGEIPGKPIVPLTGASPSAASPSKVKFLPPAAKLTQRGAAMQLERMKTCPLNSTVRQVLNTQAGLVHLVVEAPAVSPKNPSTVCNTWKCGSSKWPGKNTRFSATSTEWTGENCKYGFCDRCYGDNYPVERAVKDAVDAPGSGSSSDSSSSGSES